MEGRNPYQKVAATMVKEGTDIDFGEATNALLNTLKNKKDFETHLNQEILTIKEIKSNLWEVSVRNNISKEIKKLLQNSFSLVREAMLFGCFKKLAFANKMDMPDFP